MNFYGDLWCDFRNPRTKIRQQKLFRKKKQFEEFLRSDIALKRNINFFYIKSIMLNSKKSILISLAVYNGN